MICESCQQKLATVHLTEIVQKYKKETHLCEECAQSRGVPYKAQFSVKEFLSGLAKSDEGSEKAEGAPAAPSSVSVEGPEPCPSCGITFATFRSIGRLGCHNDYEHFKCQLQPLLEKIHGTTQHRGRIPASMGNSIERERLVASYQRELEAAVSREDYEKAARLRDKIRELEVGGLS